jgi:AraC-like DNA-binding protein
MTATQMIRKDGRAHRRNQFSDDPASADMPFRAATEFLDSALQIWEENPIQAKLQIKAATAMLRGYSDDLPANGSHAATQSDTGVLAVWQIRKVKAFIDSSLNSTIRLSNCASQARLSASYFSYAFKATFGTTLRHYIRCRRVARAQQLMVSSNRPLSEIALACGFADQAHYSRVFRDVVGLSPSTWRRRNMRLAPDE